MRTSCATIVLIALLLGACERAQEQPAVPPPYRVLEVDRTKSIPGQVEHRYATVVWEHPPAAAAIKDAVLPVYQELWLEIRNANPDASAKMILVWVYDSEAKARAGEGQWVLMAQGGPGGFLPTVPEWSVR